MTVLWTLAGAAGILGLWLGVLVTVAFCKYLVLLLRDRMMGREPRAADAQVFNPMDGTWALGGAAYYILIIILSAFVFARVGPAVAIPLALMLLALFPAAVALLAISQSGLELFDFRGQLELIRVLGKSYAWVVAVIWACALLVVILDYLGVPPIIDTFFSAYVVVLPYCLMGTLVALHGEELGLREASPQARAERQLEQEYRKVANHAYSFISRENSAGGMRHLRDYLDANKGDTELTAWFFTELSRWEDQRPAGVLAREHITRLAAANDLREALAILEERRVVEPGFMPDPAVMPSLADYADSIGRLKLAAELRQKVS